MKTVVQFSRRATNSFAKAPKDVQFRLNKWAAAVEEAGLEAVRRIPGYHDEPLKGQRKGQRSIRLGIQWRAIYEVAQDGQVIVTVMEITPHDYRTR